MYFSPDDAQECERDRHLNDCICRNNDQLANDKPLVRSLDMCNDLTTGKEAYEPSLLATAQASPCSAPCCCPTRAEVPPYRAPKKQYTISDECLVSSLLEFTLQPQSYTKARIDSQSSICIAFNMLCLT